MTQSKVRFTVLCLTAMALFGCSGDDVSSTDELPASETGTTQTQGGTLPTPPAGNSSTGSGDPTQVGCVTPDKISSPCGSSKIIKVECKFKLDDEGDTKVRFKIKCEDGKKFYYGWENGKLKPVEEKRS